MSSSSSLSGARRRRAGGGSGPTSSGQQTQRPQQQEPQQQQQPQINPFILLQQHDIKLRMIEETVREFMVNRTIDMKQGNDQSFNNSIDMEAIINVVLEKIENNFDLKSFYDNDNKLMDEISGLKKLVDSQQILINNLNTTLCGLVQNLDIKKSTSPIIEDNQPPTFPIKETIKETNIINSDFMPINEDKFKPMNIEEDNFQPMSTEEDEEEDSVLAITPVD